MSPPLHFFFTSFTACFRGKICDYTFCLKHTNIKYLSRHQTVNNAACRLQPGKSFDRCCVFQRHLWEAESLMLRPLSMFPCRCADHLLDFACAFPTSKTARGCLLLPPDGALVSRELMEGRSCEFKDREAPSWGLLADLSSDMLYSRAPGLRDLAQDQNNSQKSRTCQCCRKGVISTGDLLVLG